MLHTRRKIRVSEEMIAEAKHMLTLMGLPIIDAPGEAEAQCTALVNAGKAYAVASEDVDSLAYGTKVLLRGFTNTREPVLEVNLAEVLRCLNYSMDEFIDFCILLGCDYSATIERIGPASAYKLIQEYSSIERLIRFIDQGTTKYRVPHKFEYDAARKVFKNPTVKEASEIKTEFAPIDELRLKEFLIIHKGFNQGRVDAGHARINCAKGKPAQLRLEAFFTKPSAPKGFLKKAKRE